MIHFQQAQFSSNAHRAKSRRQPSPLPAPLQLNDGLFFASDDDGRPDASPHNGEAENNSCLSTLNDAIGSHSLASRGGSSYVFLHERPEVVTAKDVAEYSSWLRDSRDDDLSYDEDDNSRMSACVDGSKNREDGDDDEDGGDGDDDNDLSWISRTAMSALLPEVEDSVRLDLVFGFHPLSTNVFLELTKNRDAPPPSNRA
jgi:hypothetical protein